MDHIWPAKRGRPVAYVEPRHGGIHRTNRAITTYHLPLNHGNKVNEGSL